MVNANMNPNTLLLLGMSPDKIKKMHSNVVIPQPNYGTDILTKSPPSMSEEEYEQAIQEQARKDALAGASRMSSSGSRALQRDYVSVASPDRKGIINSTLNKMALSSSKTQVVTFASFKDSTGQEVVRYAGNQGKWYANGTPAEGERERNYTSIYFKAYQDALDEMGGGLNIRA